MAKKTVKKQATKKPWGGRFKGGADADVEAFTESVSFDRELALFDIAQSLAHSEMLASCGLITKKDMSEIHGGLGEISEDIISGRFKFKQELEDVHMNIEMRLAELIGPAAGKLHTARSRNDQVVTDLKLYLLGVSEEIRSRIRVAQKALVEQAEKHAETVMPGYTHTQRAQPVPLGHHLMAYFFMFERDAGRFEDCEKRMNTLPLGACALAGTALKTDPARVAGALGFAAVADNSMDAVSDRDFLLEFLAAAAICMNHLSRACEEFVLWMSSEFRFVSLPDSLCTGSSIMPQKKNPDVAELIRGKSGRITGNLVSVLMMLKALPLTYNRDMQEDKEPAFDTARTLAASLSLYGKLVRGAKFDKKRLAAAAGTGLINAVDLTDYLVLRGTPFRQAHEIVGKLVLYCVEGGKEFRDLTMEELRAASPKFGDDVLPALEPAAGLEQRKGPGAASPASVRKQIRKAKRILEREA
ncbi:MAG: argininosuccinate lyase [bacterium]